jgi:formylglycine-generating enzyme required for sulfatase activity
MADPRFSVVAVFGLISLAFPIATGAQNDQVGTNDRELVGSQAGDVRTIEGISFCWCPPGRFQMGSPPNEPGRRPDEAQCDVTISTGFWIGRSELTQGQWKHLRGELPGEIGEGEGADFPLHSVSYLEADDFCQRLTQQARESGRISAGWEFRLPTEAEWEYACRAGTTTATSFGDTMNRNQANFAGTCYNGPDEGPSLNRATPAGKYPPNPWGLHDMHGNMFEWCRDWYHSNLPGGTDPDLSHAKGTRNRDGTYSRVRRGGAFNDDGVFCRSALRLRYEPERRSDHIGLRIVLARAAAAND